LIWWECRHLLWPWRQHWRCWDYATVTLWRSNSDQYLIETHKIDCNGTYILSVHRLLSRGFVRVDRGQWPDPSAFRENEWKKEIPSCKLWTSARLPRPTNPQVGFSGNDLGISAQGGTIEWTRQYYTSINNYIYPLLLIFRIQHYLAFRHRGYLSSWQVASIWGPVAIWWQCESPLAPWL